MGDIKVSVIVPVYNASKYLSQCLDSILAQTLPQFELICVDDGSTDDSLAILRQYEEKDSRITVISQTNQYAGAARNAGKAAASGEYLVFWDADDFFKPEALEQMYARAIRDNADVCICAVNHYFEDLQKALPSQGYIKKSYVPKTLPFNRDTVPDYILNIATAHPWNKMFRREYIESMHLDFQSTRNGNDIFFVINAIARAERITVLNQALVYYRINQADSLFGSLTASPLTPINNWIATRESLILHGAYPKRSFDNKILGTLVYFLHNLQSWSSFTETFCFLQERGLAALDLKEQEDGYYYSQNNALCLSHLLHDSPEEFIVFFANHTYRENTALNGKNQEVSGKFRKQKKKLGDQTAKIQELEDAIQQEKAQVVQLEESLRDSAAQVQQLTDSLRRETSRLHGIENSRTYKLARATSFLPRFLAKVFHKKQK